MTGFEYQKGDRVRVVREGVICEVDPLDPARFGVRSKGFLGADFYFRTDDPTTVHERVDESPDADGIDDAFRLSDAKRHAERGDEFDAWLKAKRDEHAKFSLAWQAFDEALDEYRLRADLGVPLDEPTPSEVGER